MAQSGGKSKDEGRAAARSGARRGSCDGGGQKSVVPAMRLSKTDELELARVQKILAPYGLTVNSTLMMAERAVAAGYPVEGMTDHFNKEWLLYRATRAILLAPSPEKARHPMVQAARILGLYTATVAVQQNYTAVRFNEIGTMPLEHRDGGQAEGRQPLHGQDVQEAGAGQTQTG